VNQVRHVWRQIGGPKALSIWSWLITLPLALVVGNLAPQSQTQDYSVLIWTGVLLAIHVLLGAVMWLANVTLLPDRARSSRPAVAILVFMTLSALRVVLLELLDPTFGPQGTTLDSRLLTNILGGTIVLALIAVLVDDYRTHTEIENQLKQAQASLQWLAEREPEALRAADLDEIAKVRVQVEEQLRGSTSGPEHIRQISEMIVRTQSHYLAEDSSLELIHPESGDQTRQEVTNSILRGLEWPNPLAVALVVELVVFPSVVAGWSWSVAIANALIAVFFIALALVIARRFIPLPQSVVARPIAMATLLAAFAAALSFLASMLVSDLTKPFPPNVGPAVVLILAAGLGLSAWNSVTSNRQQRRESMLAAVSEEAQALERVLGEVSRRRAAAAEFLHGPIQSQLVASALKGETNEQALEAIEKRFAEYNASTEQWDVEEQVAALIDAWADVLTIHVRCAPEIWHRIQREPLTARLLVDTLSESVTNAVRHGEIADIGVIIDTTEVDARVRLTVCSVGTLSSSIGNGTGLARLIDRGAVIRLEQMNERVVLQALL